MDFVRDNHSAIQVVRLLGEHLALVPASTVQTELTMEDGVFQHVCRGLVAYGVIDRQWQEYGLTSVALLGLTELGRQVVKAL